MASNLPFSVCLYRIHFIGNRASINLAAIWSYERRVDSLLKLEEDETSINHGISSQAACRNEFEEEANTCFTFWRFTRSRTHNL